MDTGGIVNSAAGSVLGMVTGPISKALGITDTQQEADDRQITQQGRLQQQQIQGAKELGDISKANQLDIWQKTNTPAQVQEYKLAGMNPALMYNAGGAGGTTGGSTITMPTGGNASDAASAENASSKQQETGMAMQMAGAQMAALQSQTDKNKADANLSNTQADAISGHKNPLDDANTENTRQETTNKKLQADYQTIINRIQDNTAGAQTQTAIAGSQRATAEASSAQSDAEVKARIGDTRVNQAEADVKNTIADTLLKQTNNKLSQEQAQSIGQAILQRWREIDIQGANNGAQHTDRVQMMKTILEAAGIQAAGNIARDIIDTYTGAKPSSGKTIIRTDKNGEQSYEQHHNN